MKPLVVIIICGCATAAEAEPQSRAALEFGSHPLTAAASHYESPGPQATHHGLAARIERAIVDAAAKRGSARPESDTRYDAAALDLAAASTDAGTPAYAIVDFALRRHGIVDPPPHLVAATISSGSLDEDALVADLSSKLPSVLGEGRYNRIGIGIHDSGGGAPIRIVIALGESFVRVERVPRVLPVSGSFTLRGRILAPYKAPDVMVTAPSGSVDKPALVRDSSASAGSFRAVIACGGARGRHQIEVTGDDQLGTQVLANFPVYCGAEPPSVAPAATVDTQVSAPEQAESRIFDLVNEDRRAAHLPPLAADHELANVARKHSRDMQEHDFVGHISPSTGSPADRMKRAGLVAPVVLENVARAYSPEEIERGLMDSPGHRANVLSTEATRVGVGVAFGREVDGRRELFVTQLFVRRVAPPDPARAAAAVLDEINARRKRAHLRAVGRDPKLDQAAAEFSRAVAAGKATREQGQQASQRAMGVVGARYAELGTLFTVIPEVARLPDTPWTASSSLAAVGVGVAIGDSKEFGPGALFVTVLLAKGR